MRYIAKYIIQDLAKKMVFVGGPRQSGKTTLAKWLLANRTHNTSKTATSGIFLNWDAVKDRKIIKSQTWGDTKSLIIFDELHKMPKWKGWIKGVYDTKADGQNFLVTGSARLDVYRRGGDSLLGRYHYWRLHPFTLSELPEGITPQDGLHRLMTVGGFPEPFLDGDERATRRWRRERFDRVLRDDLREIEIVHDIQNLTLLVELLRARVGSPVVAANLANDLGVSPITIKKWLLLLEKMYLVFPVYPLTKDLPRAIRKPPKIYFYDNGDVIGDQGAIFENLVATSLKKQIDLIQDYTGYTMDLRYIRDKEGREVDFVTTKNGLIQELIEAKLSDDTPSKHLLYFAERFKPPVARQVVLNQVHTYTKNKFELCTAVEYLSFKHGFDSNKR